MSNAASNVEERLRAEVAEVKAELAALKAALDLFTRGEGVVVQWNRAKLRAGLTPEPVFVPQDGQGKSTTPVSSPVQAAGKILGDSLLENIRERARLQED